MKQEIVTTLSLYKDNLSDLCKYLYDNPEKSYKEFNSSKYIVNFLKDYDFNVEENYLSINTAFYAHYGHGHPKICFICEYDAIENEGHITGHNILSEISIGAALGLKTVIDKLGGTIIVLGCPGEYLGGAKITMCKQGVFKDIDVVLTAHPDITTSESGTSSAILPLSITYEGIKGFSYLNKNTYTALDGILLNFNIINTLQKGFPNNISVNGVLSQGGFSPLLIPDKSEAKFYIRANNLTEALNIESKIKNLSKSVADLMNLNHETCLYELPYEELITNRTLSRLFCHNLKEVGIIEIAGPRDTFAGLSLGSVSKLVPVIHPYISIVEDPSISYGTKDFAKATLSDFAQATAIKTSEALAFTALDLITSKDVLLKEVKDEFFLNKNNP